MPPRYVFINQPLTKSNALPWKWLGKITRLMDRPGEQYVPNKTNTAPILSDFFLQPSIDLDSRLLVTTTADERLRLGLLGVFNHDRSSGYGTTTQLESSRVVTFSLQQPDLALKAILDYPSAKTEVDTFLLNDKRAYFIVGVKLCYDGIVSVEETSQSARDTRVVVPAVEAAAIGLQVPPMIVPDGIDPQARLERKTTRATSRQYAFIEPRIFAVEFRKVNVKTPNFFDRSRQELHVSHNLPRFRPGTQVFGREEGGGKPSQQDSSDENDDSVRSSEDEDEKEKPEESIGVELASSHIEISDLNNGLGWASAAVANTENQVIFFYDIAT